LAYSKNNQAQYKWLRDKYITYKCDVPYMKEHEVRTVNYYNITICLPPKCGTTNWQSGMNVLQLLSKGVRKEPESFRTYKKQFYKLLPYYRMREGQKQFYEDFYKGYKIANVRNPFSRVYSAWQQKARTHLFPNKSIDHSSFVPPIPDEALMETLHEIAINFHIPYYPAIKLFETTEPPDGYNYSFPARVYNSLPYYLPRKFGLSLLHQFLHHLFTFYTIFFLIWCTIPFG